MCVSQEPIVQPARNMQCVDIARDNIPLSLPLSSPLDFRLRPFLGVGAGRSTILQQVQGARLGFIIGRDMIHVT